MSFSWQQHRVAGLLLGFIIWFINCLVPEPLWSNKNGLQNNTVKTSFLQGFHGGPQNYLWGMVKKIEKLQLKLPLFLCMLDIDILSTNQVLFCIVFSRLSKIGQTFLLLRCLTFIGANHWSFQIINNAWKRCFSKVTHKPWILHDPIPPSHNCIIQWKYSQMF